jgi:hypothetical protein
MSTHERDPNASNASSPPEDSENSGSQQRQGFLEANWLMCYQEKY